jgi:hypothetical protein
MTSKETNPSRLPLCVMLAEGKHMAGVLLERAVYWSQYGRAKIPHVEGNGSLILAIGGCGKPSFLALNMIAPLGRSRT